ncbi:MAG TPA: glycosyltransferase, partial [Actinotalea sp.]|nr:glycosyltransferase [Actinotalea sp.]
WTAGGEPLVFFHFSGYDPASPWGLSKHQGPAPRGLLSENPALRELCDSYGGALVAAGHLTMRTQAYRNDVLPSGLRLTPLIRRMCRDAVVGVDPDLGVPPDPWSSETEFLEWLFADDLGTGAWRHSRFERALWRARSDLRVVFPDPAMGSAEAFRTWLDEAPDMVPQYTAAGLDGRPERAGLTRPKARSRRHRRGGWSVISYARAELGVGEAGRRIGQAVAARGAPWEMVGLTDGSLSRQQHGYRGPLATVPSYANQVWCVNADQTPRLAAALGPSADGIRIGVWFWELEDFPRHFVDAFRHVDEVWVTSEFNRESISRVADKPVRLVPLPVRSAAGTPRYTRDQLGVPRDRTAFLVNFDYLSVMRRKNPIGAIEAFTRAFEPSDGAVLLIKSINGDKRLIDRERVRIAAAGRPDIIFMEHYMSAAELRGLTAVVDCVVSLHRSEGYGLNLADAMAQEKPVIATGYSGNMQFMDEGSAFLVPWQRAEVGPDAGPYSPEATWAEPDVDVAAQHMRVVAGDPSAVARVVQTARRKLACYSRASVGAAVRPLLVPDVLERSGRSLR